MAKKEELFEKETKYCKIIKSVTVEDGDEIFALEKLYIKALDRYEILIARPVDMCADKLANLLILGIKADILDKEFKEIFK